MQGTIATHVSYLDEMFYDRSPLSRVLLAKNAINYPDGDLIAGLDNGRDMIWLARSLFPRAKDAFHRSDLQVKLALKYSELPCKLKRIDVEQFYLPTQRTRNNRRWSWLRMNYRAFESLVVTFLRDDVRSLIEEVEI
jgi:hypothetical protein